MSPLSYNDAFFFSVQAPGKSLMSTDVLIRKIENFIENEIAIILAIFLKILGLYNDIKYWTLTS